MIISENTIQRIKDLSISDIVGKYIHLKNNEACCPFHNEKTPSFRINLKHDYYKCFGCGASGDGIKFVQEIDKLNFIESVEKIAKDHNIDIEYEDSKESAEDRAIRINELDSAKKALNYAHEFYQKALQNNPSALQYLQERGIDNNDIDFWGIGFAPDDYKNITTYLINNGLYEVSIKIGLIKTKNGNTYDTYRNRIIIPIKDKFGQIIGFGGRYFGDSDKFPKYINPSESFLYNKSNTLFGLNHALNSIKKSDRTHLVEGYFDCIQCFKHGLENTVAPCGTSLTDAQLKLLKKYSQNITLFFDGDNAGKTAAMKAIKSCIKNGLTPFIVQLENNDPDEYARIYSDK